MELPQRLPLVLDRPLEPADPFAGVVLQPALDVAPLPEPRLEPGDRVGVTRVGLPPALHDAGALLGQLREPLFHRLRVLLHPPPLLEGDAEAVYLALKLGESEFDGWDLGLHGFAHYPTFLVFGDFFDGAFLAAGLREGALPAAAFAFDAVAGAAPAAGRPSAAPTGIGWPPPLP